MQLQKGKWYVCIKSWSDDGWCKFAEGDLLQCEYDNIMRDRYGITHLFVDDEVEQIFREATESESNIANATIVDMDEFMEDIGRFEPNTTLADIYRYGAERMLKHIREHLTINGE